MVVKRARILLTCFIQYILNVDYKILGGIKKNKIQQKKKSFAEMLICLLLLRKPLNVL